MEERRNRERALKKTLKNFISNTALKHGYTVIPQWRLDAHPLARHLVALFARYDVDCVLDVGGNLGQFHDFIRDDVGFKGPIVSFEPVGKYVKVLVARSQQDSRWRIMPHALGASECTAEINVTKSPGLNSFLAPRSDVVDDYWKDDSVSGTETVQIRMLDNVMSGLMKELGFARPYLKLDTQGFDLEALKGARGTLPSVRALQTEASVRPLYQGMPTYQEVIDHLNGEGFDLSGMFPVTVDAALRLVEFDCVAVNRSFIA